MDQSDLVALLEGAITEPGGRWAELGAGDGNFIVALAGLLVRMRTSRQSIATPAH